MSHFFQATGKVQKDRQVMRETDARMAKYSRRGLIFNFIAFLVCLIGGRFIGENKELTILLASGLLLVTVLRGFYLFRFEQLYPRGPARWRNAYFVVTLVGAIWWGVILASITLVLGVKDETPLLWIYTVVFFSTTAHAFAPYHRFLSYYQFFGLIPAAGAAFALGDWTSQMYGAVMFIFYLILTHQCRLISDNYWEKLEAGYALGRRTVSDEQAQIARRTNLQLSKEFIANLDAELSLCLDEQSPEQAGGAKSVLRLSKLNALQENVQLFNAVLNREMTVENRVFNVRHELQYLVSEFIELAEKRDIQIETSLSASLPMRLKGDPARFAQIVRTILSQYLEGSSSAAIVLEIQFLREYETAGELYITLRRVSTKATSAIPFFSEHEPATEPKSLALTTAKGLAELMEGEISVFPSPNNDYQVRFNARLEVADNAGQLDFHKDRFTGKTIQLISSNPTIADIKRQELEALGFSILTETQFQRAIPNMQARLHGGSAIDNILIYHDPDDINCVEFMLDLLKDDEFQSINKIVAASQTSQKGLLVSGFTHEKGFYFLNKPLGLFELETTLEFIYSRKGDEESLSRCRAGRILIIDSEEGTQRLSAQCREFTGQETVIVKPSKIQEYLKDLSQSVVVIPCLQESSVADLITTIRTYELEQGNTGACVPIIGIGTNCSESDINAFEVGFDDFINLTGNNSRTLMSVLRFWRSLEL